MEEQKDCDYIDNVITSFYDNYICNTVNSNKSLEIFAQYLQYIVNHFLDRTSEILPCNISEISLSIVTPRLWGYRINETDVHKIVEKSGLTQEVTVYNDLNVRLECIQQAHNVGRLRKCLFCTFFLDSRGSLLNSIATFFSGNYYDSAHGDFNIKPVNCKSFPSVAHNVDVTGIYTKLKVFIVAKIQDPTIQIDDCISSILQFLRVSTVK